MSKFYFTNDMPTAVKEIVTEAREQGKWNGYNLAPYGKETLDRCLMYLEDKGIYLSLQKEIRCELAIRYTAKSEATVKSYAWFEEMWWAVLSLFGKGEMKSTDKRTKDILSRIDKRWIYNCGARL